MSHRKFSVTFFSVSLLCQTGYCDYKFSRDQSTCILLRSSGEDERKLCVGTDTSNKKIKSDGYQVLTVLSTSGSKTNESHMREIVAVDYKHNRTDFVPKELVAIDRDKSGKANTILVKGVDINGGLTLFRLDWNEMKKVYDVTQIFLADGIKEIKGPNSDGGFTVWSKQGVPYDVNRQRPQLDNCRSLARINREDNPKGYSAYAALAVFFKGSYRECYAVPSNSESPQGQDRPVSS